MGEGPGRDGKNTSGINISGIAKKKKRRAIEEKEGMKRREEWKVREEPGLDE